MRQIELFEKSEGGWKPVTISICVDILEFWSSFDGKEVVAKVTRDEQITYVCGTPKLAQFYKGKGMATLTFPEMAKMLDPNVIRCAYNDERLAVVMNVLVGQFTGVELIKIEATERGKECNCTKEG